MVERVLSALLGLPFLLGAAAAPSHSGDVEFSFQDPAIVEASALVDDGDLVFTSNDSGDTGRVFAVDPSSGETVGVTHWSDDPVDVESLAPGPVVDGSATVWVGDIGDNAESRDTIQVAQVPVGVGDRTVAPTVYDLAYPDGSHDAETLVRDPADGRLYVATKGVFGGTLYAAPLRLSADHVNRLTAVGPVLPIATDGAFLGDGRHLIVRNYTAATIYDWPSLEQVATVSLPAEPQGEGIAVRPDGAILLDSEGLHSDVLRLSLSRRLRSAVDQVPPPSHPMSDTAHPAPSSAPPDAPSQTSATTATSSTDHTPAWVVAAAVLVLGVALATSGLSRGRRRRGR